MKTRKLTRKFALALTTRVRAAMLLIAMLCVAGGAWAQQALPYDYDFENNDLAADGWTTQNPSGLNASYFGINSTSAMNGSYGFQFSSYNQKGENTQYLISPELNTPKGVIVQFYYKVSSSSSTGETFQVGYSTTDAEITSFTFSPAVNPTNTSWEQTEKYVFPAGTKYVAVYYSPDYQYRLYVDDFSFSVEGLDKPTDLTANNLTASGATISWTAPEGSPTGYAYQYKKASEENWSAEATTAATSVALNGLTRFTDYQFRVKAIYSGGESGFATMNFKTEFGQASLPYADSFEEGIGGWTLVDCASGTGSTSGNYHEGSKCFRFYHNTNPPQYLISPEFEGDAAPMAVSFWYMIHSSKYPEAFQVGYSTTTNDVAEFTWEGEVTATNAAEWLQYETYFPAGTKYVAIKLNSNDQYYLYVDDFTFEAYSGYAKPTDLTVNDLTNSGATISWTAPEGSPTGYAYQYKKASEENWSAEASVTATSVTLSGLEAGISYDFHVKAVYGSDGESVFATIHFTVPLCMGGRVIEYSLTDSYGDGWGDNAIQVLDGCGNVVETLTIAEGASDSGVLFLCEDAYQFAWKEGKYPGECSFTFTENSKTLFTKPSELNDGDVLYTIGTIYPIPTDLTAGTPGKNSVVLNWTADGSETAWEICINGDEANVITASTNVNYELSGLEPETEYTVKVRACFDATTYSCWSKVITFTTDVAFPAPKAVAANHVKVTTADISWTGDDDATSYNLRYVTGIVGDFFEDFENGLDRWTVVRDGGGEDGTDWHIVNSSTLFSEAIPAHSGDYVCMARSYNGSAYNVDNWLISPKLPLGATMTFWVRDDDKYHEHYDIYVSTTTTDLSAFKKVYEPGDASGEWTEVTVDLSAYAGQTGYIAFRLTDEDQDFLFIDDITIAAPSIPIEWTTVNNVANPYTIEGLTPKTLCTVEVQAVYEGGSSTWTSTTFSTSAADAVPSNLQTADITTTSATLNWDGVQDSYNVRYRKNPVFYYTSFNSDEERDGWSFSAAIYGLDDTANNIPGNSNYFLSMGWSTTDEDFIYSPELPAYPSGSTLEFHHYYYSGENTFQFGYSTTTNDVDDFTWSDPIASVSAGEAYTAKYSMVLPDGVKYIAFRATASDQGHCIFIDNIKIYDAAAIDKWDETVSNVNAHTLAIDGLTSGTNYEWQVQGIYNEEPTKWSKVAPFTTIAVDAVPSNLQTANVTGTTATLNWDGVQDSYNVRYRKNLVLYCNPFNSDEDLDGWSFSLVITGLDDPVYNIPGENNIVLPMGWSTTDEEFIISPELPAFPSESILEFYHFYYSEENTFQFGYSTTTNDVDDFTWSDPIATVPLDEAYTAKYSMVLPDGVKYIAFRATASDQDHCIFIDDIKICGGEWVETVSNVNAHTLAIDGLTPGTNYEWQVQGIYNEEPTKWSEIASFTTQASITLSDADDNSTVLEACDGKELEVTLLRTLQAGGYNTFAAPFAISSADLSSLGITAKKLTSSSLADNTLTLTFADAEEIEAGKPYLVKVDDNLNLGGIAFDGVIVSKETTNTETEAVDFIPTLGATAIETDDVSKILFLGAENTLYRPNTTSSIIKGFRAYFQLKEEAEVKSFVLDFGDGDIATGIFSMDNGQWTMDNDAIYDLQGRRFENKPAQRGIYVKNGKKVIIK